MFPLSEFLYPTEFAEVTIEKKEVEKKKRKRKGNVKYQEGIAYLAESVIFRKNKRSKRIAFQRVGQLEKGKEERKKER